MADIKSTKKYILVDSDGLLLDTEEIKFEIYRQILANHGKNLSIDEYKKLVGLSRQYICNYFCKKKKLDIKSRDLAAEKKVKYSQEVSNDRIKPIKNNIRIVKELAKLYPLALVTSQNKKITAAILKKLKINNIFKIVITGEKTINKKPAPDIYLYAMEKLSAKPKECIVLEDSQPGIIAAKKAGAFCIAIPNKLTIKQNLNGADTIFYKTPAKTIVDYIKRIKI